MTSHSIWKAFSEAIGAELREHAAITGASGLEHQVQAIAVDDKGKRVIVVVPEPNARIARLIQADIQASVPNDTNIIVARPHTVDIGEIVRRTFNSAGEAFLTLKPDQKPSPELEAIVKPMLTASTHSNMPPLSEILSVILQLAALDWQSMLKSFNDNPSVAMVSLAGIYNTKAFDFDLAQGICPIPLYQLNENDWELMRSGTHIDDIRQRLKDLNVYQYFFPAPDATALGLVDKGVRDSDKVIEAVRLSPAIGHPLGDNAFARHVADVADAIDALKHQGFVAAAEVETTITPAGTEVRSRLKILPSEGYISKLINRTEIKLSASLKDILPD